MLGERDERGGVLEPPPINGSSQGCQVCVCVSWNAEVQRELAARLEAARIVTHLTLAAGAPFRCQGKGGTEDGSADVYGQSR